MQKISRRYNSYRDHLSEKYGHRIQKISLRADFTCPNRDGVKGFGGCTFCNNDSFSDPRKNQLSIEQQIIQGISRFEQKKKNYEYLVYFQTYSNTYAPTDYLKKLYYAALSHPKVIGLVIGTRPDCIDEEKLTLLSEIKKNHDVYLEYGVESVFNDSLKKINRGHDFKCFYDAILASQKFGIDVGVHVMIGFPWENKKQWIDMAKILSGLPIKFLKIHQLLIVKDTVLAHQHHLTPFQLLSKEQYLDILGQFINHLRPDIIVQRMYSSAMNNLLIAPIWCSDLRNFGLQIDQYFEVMDIRQGSLYDFAAAQACLEAAVTQVPCSLISSRRQLQ